MKPTSFAFSNIQNQMAKINTLFGLAGFIPDYNGGLEIRPNTVEDGNISIKSFGFRGHTFDMELSKQLLKVHKNGTVFYEGKPCLRTGLPIDQDVYDTAAFSSVVELSEGSVLNNSNSI